MRNVRGPYSLTFDSLQDDVLIIYESRTNMVALQDGPSDNTYTGNRTNWRGGMQQEGESALHKPMSTIVDNTCLLDGTLQFYNLARLDTVDWFAAEEDPSPPMFYTPLHTEYLDAHAQLIAELRQALIPIQVQAHLATLGRRSPHLTLSKRGGDCDSCDLCDWLQDFHSPEGVVVLRAFVLVREVVHWLTLACLLANRLLDCIVCVNITASCIEADIMDRYCMHSGLQEVAAQG
eukprot:3410937-Amphidinium_carterae.1